jgi:hypothetical protein
MPSDTKARRLANRLLNHSTDEDKPVKFICIQGNKVLELEYVQMMHSDGNEGELVIQLKEKETLK